MTIAALVHCQNLPNHSPLQAASLVCARFALIVLIKTTHYACLARLIQMANDCFILLVFINFYNFILDCPKNTITNTRKMNCPARLYFKLSNDGKYYVLLNMTHHSFHKDLVFPSGIVNYSGKDIEKAGPIRTVRISNVHRCSSVTSQLIPTSYIYCYQCCGQRGQVQGHG
ncbi:unnamed protein product [Trichogramma brassicae]|uniref:Uncharacterized protein n=1 Tax=Trichogramma brassicae TaxID=86971 RepID=A0A6H5IQU8_9HYME|nr:unnamed protein product [Trichogramma brassicae]